MPNVNTLPLSIVCNVTVMVSPVAAATPLFNQALIVGPSLVIPASSGVNPRVRQYSSLAQMTTDGFTNVMPEYISAQLYFAQGPTLLWVGRQDLTVPETCLQALQACRAACPNWWCCTVTSAVTADHLLIVPWINGLTQQSAYVFTTGDAAVLALTAGNVAATMQTLQYGRTLGIYSTAQAGAFPNNIYSASAAMGVAMGLNTYLANSNFTMKFKTLVGIAPEPITQTQVAGIEALNMNVYANSANVYNWLEQGVQPNGAFFDETLNLDMLASDLQYSMANAFISSPGVPRNNAGQASLLAIANQCCDRAVTRGFISPGGVWTGQTVLSTVPNSPMPKGYFCESQPFSVQSASAKAARSAMPIYVTICEAGSMHNITIGVYPQR